MGTVQGFSMLNHVVCMGPLGFKGLGENTIMRFKGRSDDTIRIHVNLSIEEFEI
jgi:hypothetical protein